MNITPEQYDSLRRAIENIQKTVDRIDADLASDRKDIDKLSIEMGTIKDQNGKIMDLYDRQTRKIKETVQDAIEDQVSPVKEAVEEIGNLIGESK